MAHTHPHAAGAQTPGHHHHHHHHPTPQGTPGGVFVFSIVLNLAYLAAEAGIGLWQGSLSLLSDAGHNLSDVFSLVLVLVAFRLARIHPDARHTYGYKKSTVLISLLNALLLLVAVGAIVVEAIHDLRAPADIDGATVSWTALAGIVVNGVTALLLMRGQQADLNVRGAFLHMVADTLVSVGVVVSGLVILWTGWTLVDPIVSLIIAAVILVSTWRLLSDSLRLAVDGMPDGVTLAHVHDLLRSADSRVRDVHHVHVWAISTTDNALTAHIVVDDLAAMEDVKARLKHALADVGIGHATLEVEAAGACCGEACACSCSAEARPNAGEARPCGAEA